MAGLVRVVWLGTCGVAWYGMQTKQKSGKRTDINFFECNGLVIRQTLCTVHSRKLSFSCCLANFVFIQSSHYYTVLCCVYVMVVAEFKSSVAVFAGLD